MAVRRERGHRGGPLEAVAVRILARKLALPGVGHVPAVRRQLVAPRIVGAVEPAGDDLSGIRNKQDLIMRVQERYNLPHWQAMQDVELWAEAFAQRSQRRA